MGGLLKFLFELRIIGPLLKPITRPVFRLLLGLIAIPIFRFICRRVFRIQEMDEELEKDLEQWFKASLVLLAATKNMEAALFGVEDYTQSPWITGLRIMMAIGVIEMMPDQELFAIIHPGPQPLKYDRKKGLWYSFRTQWYDFGRGLICQHLNRSSPVFAILCAIFDGPAGWICFFMAITQYLIIGLVTSRDRMVDVLADFDAQVAIRRRQIQEEFDLEDDPPAKPEPTKPEKTEPVAQPLPDETPGVTAEPK